MQRQVRNPCLWLMQTSAREEAKYLCTESHISKHSCFPHRHQQMLGNLRLSQLSATSPQGHTHPEGALNGHKPLEHSGPNLEWCRATNTVESRDPQSLPTHHHLRDPVLPSHAARVGTVGGSKQIWGTVLDISLTELGVKHSIEHKHEQEFLPKVAASCHSPCQLQLRTRSAATPRSLIRVHIFPG